MLGRSAASRAAGSAAPAPRAGPAPSAREDRRSRAGEHGVEHAAVAGAAADADRAALGLDDAACEDEAEAGARRLARARAGAELLDLDEEALDLIGGDADARVLDL